MFCPQCGHSAFEDANYCPTCGTSLKKGDPPEAKTTERLETCKVLVHSEGDWNVKFHFVAWTIDEHGEHEIARSDPFKFRVGLFSYVYYVETNQGPLPAPQKVPESEKAWNGLLASLAKEGWDTVSFGAPNWWNVSMVRHRRTVSER